MGIRFAASTESNAAPNLKEVYVKATQDDIVLIDSPCRITWTGYQKCIY